MTSDLIGRFPAYRPRRLRQTPAFRRLVRETDLRIDQLVLPLFVRSGRKTRRAIRSMPGQFQLSPDELLKTTSKAFAAGIGSVLLFGIPDRKDAKASGAYARDGIVQQSIRLIKKELPELIVIADVCLCEYMSHGHCGIVRNPARRKGSKPGKEASILNDPSLELLARSAVSLADAGADIVAPSDMMDGRVQAIRAALDDADFSDTPILSYAAKFASGYYGPFRDAAESTPQFGDRRSYQMEAGNAEEALREVAMDIREGADIVMVKPALAYLDIVRRVKERFGYPTAVYSVSAEYSMIKAAAEKGWIDERSIVMENLTAMRRAGADIIVTYHALDAARWLAQPAPAPAPGSARV